MSLQDQIFFLIVYFFLFVESCFLNLSALKMAIQKRLSMEIILIILNLLIITFYMIMFCLIVAILYYQLNYSLYFIKYAIVIFNIANILYLIRLIAGAYFVRNVIKLKEKL